MDIQYYYITNHVKNKGISIQHCLTEEILAAFFTKPLQGSLFLKLRNAIMGHGPPSPQNDDHRSVLRNIPTWNPTWSPNLEPQDPTIQLEPALASNAIGNPKFGSPSVVMSIWPHQIMAVAIIMMTRTIMARLGTIIIRMNRSLQSLFTPHLYTKEQDMININKFLSRDQILVSCSHMTCYLQNLHYISIYIFY